MDNQTPETSQSPFAVEMRSIWKEFPGTLACSGVDLAVHKGEIHAILGENGAGKTTLTSILYGLLSADSGTISLFGKQVQIRSPRDAMNLGIGMVHQRPLLIPRLTVAENIFVGLFDESETIEAVEDKVRELGRQYQFSINPRARVWDLCPGECQRVEILKALYRDAKVLIMDEPTASLTPEEVRGLFQTLQIMVDEGMTIIFITHKLKEVMEVSNRVTILRNGGLVDCIETETTSEQQLASKMIGRDVVLEFNPGARTPGEDILRVEDLRLSNPEGDVVLDGVSFCVRAGQIFGIAGVSGNGQRELVEVLAGIRPCTVGRIILEGRVQETYTPDRAVEQGVGFLPEDILGMAVAPDLSLIDNTLLKTYLANPSLTRRGFLNHHRINEYANRLVEEFQVRTAGIFSTAGSLSGGNLRKLVLAREICRQPRLLILNQPNKGLDVSATEYLTNRILEQREAGCAVVLVSDNLDEVLSLSDVVGVMTKGRLMGVQPKENIKREEVGMLMGGAC